MTMGSRESGRRQSHGCSCAGDAAPPTDGQLDAGETLAGQPCNSRTEVQPAPMGATARAARLVAGLAFLALAGALSPRRLAGEIELWPGSLVAAWFGVSHLLASTIEYRGCPELGAIPSVLLGRRVETSCGPWRRIDARIDALRVRAGAVS